MSTLPFHTKWRTSSYSSGSGQCTEVAPTLAGVAVRDSTDPCGPVFILTPGAWRTLLHDAATLTV